MANLTPLRRQYLEIKSKHPDAIVFFQLGDFYEAFDEDAEIVADELDVVLTSRPVAKNQRIPMAGVPCHAIEGYVARLIEKGYRVAIADQMGDTTTSGLVVRQVSRVVTPGTVIEPELLQEKAPNYLAAAVIEQDSGAGSETGLSVGRAGLAYVDITTGEFATTQLGASEVQQELARVQPRECLLPVDADGQPQVSGLKPLVSGAHITPLPAYRFELGAARRTLLDHFRVATLDGFGCAGKPLAIRAAGAILHYLRETQKKALKQIVSLSTYSTSRFMRIDANTRLNLEITETLRDRAVRGSLLGVLDETLSPMGGRLLRSRLAQPLLSRQDLEERLDEVEALYQDTILRGKVREILRGIPDLERLTNRVVGGSATPRDLVGIKHALRAVPELAELLSQSEVSGARFTESLAPCEGVADLLSSAIVDDPPRRLSACGVIRRGFSIELDDLLGSVHEAREWLASLERREQQRTGIRSLKVGHNKVFGYYIEVTKANIDAVPDEYTRKQTLTNSERYIIPELKEVETRILTAEDRQSEVEARLFSVVCQQVAARAEPMLRTARTLARLDVASALAEVAVSNRYVRPALIDEDVLDITAGRHPVVETTQRDEPFTPNDLRLNDVERILIITGPNMAGKSVYLRQAALIVLMAQIGSFVPADEAQIGIVDRIFTRIGAQDEVAFGHSTFMVEMVETANILNHATPRSLLILDEVGRGTSTYDGLSIAWAVVEYLHNHPERRARTLFATHYHELTEMAQRLPAVRNYNLAVVEEGKQVVFLHRVEPGGADRSYGIHVAQLAGVPRPVIHRAQELLTQLESGAFRPGTEKPEPHQPVLFADEHPVVEAVRELDVSSMTPLEAINKLYELQKRAQE
ncbi:MAG: DNA mismatch repair protein MutS [Anaerolineae bacterium]|jgi:DNA mismatch repair protein MutS